MARLGRAQPKRAFVTRAPIEVTEGGITPGAVTITVTSGTLTVRREEQIVPAAVSVTVTPGTLSVVFDQAVIPAVVTVTVTPGSLSIAQSIAPAATTVSVTPGSLGVVREEQIAPEVVTVTVTPGSLGVVREEQITPEVVTVTATPGSLSVVREEQIVPAVVTVSVTPGSLNVALTQDVTPGAVTVTVTPGSLVITQIVGPTRDFDGTDDFIDFDPGIFDTLDSTEEFHFAVIWKADTVQAGGLFWSNLWNINPYSDGNIYFTNVGSGFVTGPSYTTGVWYLTMFTRPAGTGQVRSHTYNFTTDVWSHADHGSLGSTAGADVGFLRVGRFAAVSEYLDGRIAAMAVWVNSAPWAPDSSGDATIEAADLEKYLQEWVDAGPDLLWRFNQDSTAEDILDLTGGGADQQAITGTTVDTTDAPDDFSFVLGGVTPDPVTVEVTPGSLNVFAEYIPTYQTVVVTRRAVEQSRAMRSQPYPPLVDFGPPALVSGLELAAPTVAITPGTLTVAVDQFVTPAPVTVTVTPGSLSLSMAVVPAPVTVTVTPGSLVVTTGPVDITPAATTVSVTPGSLTVVQGQTVVPFDTTVAVTPGSLAITTGPVDIAPAPVSVSVTPGSLGVVREEQVTPGVVTVDVTPGSLSVVPDQSVAPTVAMVNVTPGSLLVAADQAVTLTAPSVSVSPGTLTIVPGDAPIAPEPVAVTVTPGTLSVVGGVFSAEDADWEAHLLGQRWQVVLEGSRWHARLGGDRWLAHL